MIDLVLFVLASPILSIKAIRRGWRRYRFYRVAYSGSLPCPNCKETISLLGMWRCSCSYVYTGHLMRACPICHTLPRMARCFSCGNTLLLPMP